MDPAQEIVQEIARLLRAVLDAPGLVPRWTSSVDNGGDGPTALPGTSPEILAQLKQLVGDRARLARKPAVSWHPALLHFWRLGVVYLRDEESHLSATAEISGRRVVIRASTLGAFAVVSGDVVLVDGSLVGGLASLHGPLAVAYTQVDSQVALGPNVVIANSAIGPFVKAQRGIRIDGSAIGSHTSLEGESHPEKIPLGPRRRASGVRVGPAAWVGRHVSVTAGAVIGAEVVVAPFTSVTQPVPDHMLVSGTPARIHPIGGHAVVPADEAGADRGSRPTLSVIADMLRGALSADVDIDVDTPFYVIGVDSLTAADLAARIELEFRIEAPDVFANNTLRLLSTAVDRCLAG